jgi:hypothetical protein
VKFTPTSCNFIHLWFKCSLQHHVLKYALYSHNITDKVSNPYKTRSKIIVKKKKTPWSESASELYRPSESRFSAKCCQLVRIEGATWSA